MSDTPETDAFFIGTDIDWDLEVQFAKRLERERDKAREQRDRLAEALRKLRDGHMKASRGIMEDMTAIKSFVTEINKPAEGGEF